MSRLSDHEARSSPTIISFAIAISSTITANSSIPMLVTETSKRARYNRDIPVVTLRHCDAKDATTVGRDGDLSVDLQPQGRDDAGLSPSQISAFIS